MGPGGREKVNATQPVVIMDFLLMPMPSNENINTVSFGNFPPEVSSILRREVSYNNLPISGSCAHDCMCHCLSIKSIYVCILYSNTCTVLLRIYYCFNTVITYMYCVLYRYVYRTVSVQVVLQYRTAQLHNTVQYMHRIELN